MGYVVKPGEFHNGNAAKTDANILDVQHMVHMASPGRAKESEGERQRERARAH